MISQIKSSAESLASKQTWIRAGLREFSDQFAKLTEVDGVNEAVLLASYEFERNGHQYTRKIYLQTGVGIDDEAVSNEYGRDSELDYNEKLINKINIHSIKEICRILPDKIQKLSEQLTDKIVDISGAGNEVYKLLEKMKALSV